jgi:GntR family transcriptional repressor for pyruvate dehydrogenase complex
MSDPASPAAPPPGGRRRGADGPRRAPRPTSIVRMIKDMIAEEGLRPGDRLPGEAALMARFGASKGSVREAVAALGAHGLARSRTGPGGGLFLTAIPRERTVAALVDAFAFDPPQAIEVYALRLMLEPALAESLAGRLSEADLAELEALTEVYAAPARDAEEERAQRDAELDFHDRLAARAPSRLLGLLCAALTALLRDAVAVRAHYDQPMGDLRAVGLAAQRRLIEALRAGDPTAAREASRTHMEEAARRMIAAETRLAPRLRAGPQ